MHDVPDLDLLRCFTVLHRERHLSRAAVRAGLSQPAMSRALGRLREAFGDPLFVRTPHGMLPTARADALAPRVTSVIEAAGALVRPVAFEPARLARAFVVATAGFFDGQLVPRLVQAMARQAPGVEIITRAIAGDTGDALATGRCDLMISIAEGIPSTTRRVRLYEESFVCAARRGHPGIGRRLTLKTYVALPHLLIAPGGSPGSPVDSALAARGLARRVAVRIHTFPAAPVIVAGSDLILTAPSRVIAPLAEPFGLRLYPPPLPLASFPVFAAWHPRVHDDPAHIWFRGQVAAAFRADARTL